MTRPLAVRAARWAARQVTSRARARFGRRGVVLLYHRVADLPRDPWDLAVAPRAFERHVAELARRRYAVLSLGELVEAAGRRRLPRRAVALTFDDAYADVARNALPVLEQRRVPATVFAISGAVGTGREFWWDALERLVLDADALPDALPLPDADGRPLAVPPSARGRAAPPPPAADRRWRALTGAHPTPRHALYRDAWSRLQPLGGDARRAALDALADAVAAPAPSPDARSMSADELRAFSRSPVGTVGAHTVTHPLLAALPPEAQAAELGDGRRALETVLGTRVDLFAYPFGNRGSYTADTVRLVRDAGFRAACVNEPGPVRPDVDVLRIPRVYVSGWDPAEFAGRLERVLRE